MLTVIDLVILGASVWVALYFYFTRHFGHWKSKNVPFLKPLPFFGNILDGILMRKSMGELFADAHKQSADKFVGMFLLDQPCLLIRAPQLIKDVLVNNFASFYDRSAATNTKDDPLGSYILFAIKNPDWRDLRTKMTPVFTSAKMKMMHQLIRESAGDMVDYLTKRVSAKDAVIETRELTAKYTTDVITSTSFGVKANCFEEEDAPFRLVSRKIFDWTDLLLGLQMRCYFLAPGLVKLFRMKLLDGGCTSFLKETFLRIMKERIETGNSRNDLLDILIQLQAQDQNFELKGDKLVAQAIQFFVAGFETSSTAMSYALYELAKNPRVQAKLRSEIDEFYAKHDGEFTYDLIKDMPYMDLVVKETLRKYPPLPFLDRRCNVDYTLPDTDVVIDKGTPLFVSLLGLHYDPKHFPEPDEFVPERFVDFDTKNFTYLPFGDGPRNCIGERFAMLSTKLGLSHVLKHFAVEVCDRTITDIKFEPRGFLLSPVGGIMLKYKALQ